MRSSKTNLMTLVALTFLLGSQNVVQAAVFDGGTYSQDKVSSHTDLGTDGPEPQPSNFAFEQDRFSSAPVGKPLYVLGDDHKCYWGNFAYNKYEKALIVYYKTPISSDRCIYQKQLDSKPSGYSISANMGGVCVPTLGVGEVASNGSTNSWKLEEVGNPVAFSLCVDQTASFGDYFKKSGPEQQVAVVAPAAPATKVKVNTAKQELVIQDEGTAVDLGPSVQEGNVPWKSGAVYREGFSSLNNEARNWHDQPATERNTAAAPPAEVSVQVTASDPVVQGFAPRHPQTVTEVTPSAVIPDGIVTKSDEGSYTVQVSSSTSQDEAKKAVSKLAANGVEDSWVMQAEVHGTTYYRVCIGHYATNRAAKLAQPKIAVKAGVKEAFIQKVVDRSPSSVSGQHD